MPNDKLHTQNLATCYENALTIILRLATMHQSAKANSQDFRTSIRSALRAAMEQAKSLGYSSDAIQLSFFAVVSLLDESVLKLQSPAFADWAQRPLQEEMFGHNRAGEVFFEHLRMLLARQDSPETADCLEVYCLCLLLGFKGRYALSSAISFTSGSTYSGGQTGAWSTPRGGEIHALIRTTREKIDRIRGPVKFLPQVAVPEVKQASVVDLWGRGLGIVAILLFLVMTAAFAFFWWSLDSAASRLG